MDRKTKVKVLSEFFGAPLKYLGAPTFAYATEVDGDVYSIDRVGVIYRNDEETTLEAIVNSRTEEVSAQETATDVIELTLPLEGHTGTTLQSLVNMLTSRQHLLMKALRTQEQLVEEYLAEELSKVNIITIHDFRAALESIGNEHKKILFDFENRTLTIKLKSCSLSNDEIKAFTVLLSNINFFAKKQKRTSYKRVQDDNPKFALRTWITRIGMKGEEYKEVRKVLLSNLEGNGAFRNPTKERG